jgi:hypothetical protein
MAERMIRRHILKKLYAYGAFRHGHMLGERLWRGIPAHHRGLAKSVLAELVRERVVLEYPTLHGAAYQLNIEKLDSIERELF